MSLPSQDTLRYSQADSSGSWGNTKVSNEKCNPPIDTFANLKTFFRTVTSCVSRRKVTVADDLKGRQPGGDSDQRFKDPLTFAVSTQTIEESEKEGDYHLDPEAPLEWAGPLFGVKGQTTLSIHLRLHGLTYTYHCRSPESHMARLAQRLGMRTHHNVPLPFSCCGVQYPKWDVLSYHFKNFHSTTLPPETLISAPYLPDSRPPSDLAELPVSSSDRPVTDTIGSRESATLPPCHTGSNPLEQDHQRDNPTTLKNEDSPKIVVYGTGNASKNWSGHRANESGKSAALHSRPTGTNSLGQKDQTVRTWHSYFEKAMLNSPKHDFKRKDPITSKERHPPEHVAPPYTEYRARDSAIDGTLNFESGTIRFLND